MRKKKGISNPMKAIQYDAALVPMLSSDELKKEMDGYTQRHLAQRREQYLDPNFGGCIRVIDLAKRECR